MADYHMTYSELDRMITDFINRADDNKRLLNHKVEILSALTLEDSEDNVNTNRKDITDMIALWDNQIQEPSQFLMGTRYIRIKDSMVELIEMLACSGLLDAIIQKYSGSEVSLSISMAAGVVVALVKVFKSASKLDDWDFCIYRQAVYHYKSHKSFTKADLVQWFPCGNRQECNMHDSKWDCDYLGNDDTCSIVLQDKLDGAIKSLMIKKLLDEKINSNGINYTFVY